MGPIGCGTERIGRREDRMREREVFLDKLRVAATCAVVLLHTVTGVMDATDMSLYPAERKVFLAVMDLVCWSVPVFLMISGYLFLQPERRIGMGMMLTRYCRRIALALFLFGVPYACLELTAVRGGFRPEMAWEAFLMVLRGEGWSHMWYLYLILALYLMTPFLRWLLARMSFAAACGLCFLLFLCFSVLPWLARLFGWEEIAALPDWGIYLFYYICGYLFAEESRRERSWAAWGKVLAILAAAVAAGMALSRLAGGYALQMAYNYPFTVLLALLLFGRGAGSGKKLCCPQAPGAFPLREQASLCFTVYLIHPVFLNMAYKYFHLTPLSDAVLPSWLAPELAVGFSLLLFFAGTLSLSVAGAWALRKIPPLRRYVL